MKKSHINFSKPSLQQLNVLLKYYQNRKFIEAEKSAILITQEFPEHQFAWKVLAAVYRQTGKIKESLAISQKSLLLAPFDAEAHFNLGNTLKDLERLEEAEASYKKSIELKQDYADAYNNLGVTLQKLGRLEEAEVSCKKAISLKPDLDAAYNNLGSVLQELGRLEEAMNAFVRSIELNPHLPGPLENLMELLTFYTPQKNVESRIVKVNKEINAIYTTDNLEIISDDKIIQLFCKSTNIIKKYGLKLRTDLIQVYRRNSIDLNCKRHKKIFNKYNIIPKYCFGCYKVQVEPRSILELIKLFVVFDQIKLTENNSRKCMIERRPEFSGFYKGLIYCSSLEEAYKIADYLQVVLNNNIGPGLYANVKRGCSEYPISFPDYKKINKSGPQLMNYNKNWKSIEEEHDSLSSIRSNKIIIPSLSSLNLKDILIIRNWIDYAKGIGDSSANSLNQNSVFSPKIYKEAKTRIEKYPWQDYV